MVSRRVSRPFERGFTLIEIIVILVMMVVFSAMVLPSYQGMIRGSEIRAATRAIVAQLRAAREYAIAHQQAVTIIYDSDTGGLIPRPEAAVPTDEAEAEVEEESDAAASGQSSPQRILPPISLPQNVTLSLSSRPDEALESSTITPLESEGITFEADGSCLDTQIVMEGPDFPPVVIQVTAGGSRVEVTDEERS